MTDKELRRLSRGELLQLLLEQTQENDQLRGRLESIAEKLAQREIANQNAGSIAEAALAINQVFEAADAAAKQYIQTVQDRIAQQEQISEKYMTEASAKADAVLQQAQEQAEKIRTEAEELLAKAREEAQKCRDEAIRESEDLREKTRGETEQMVAKAKEESRACWNEINIHMQALKGLFQDASQHSGN